MAEYWKSQPKHYCEFCNCWIADNKPSRDYHEKGKKHRQNVEAKISRIHEKSRQDAKRESEMSDYIKEMEKNALRAAKKDLQNDPSLAHLYGVKVKEKEETKEYGPANKDGQESISSDKKEGTDDTTDYNSVEYWSEDKSPEGYTYYWNTVTGESRWIPPEGYIPKADRKELEEEQEKISPENIQGSSSESESEKEESEGVREPRGTKRKKDTEEPEIDVSAIPLPGSISSPPSTTEDQEVDTPQATKPESIEERVEAPKHTAYSQWETVQEPEPEPDVDLQLPSTKAVEEAILVVPPEPKIKFREKTVPSLNKDNMPVFFKKKKKGIGYKNLKARTEDS